MTVELPAYYTLAGIPQNVIVFSSLCATTTSIGALYNERGFGVNEPTLRRWEWNLERESKSMSKTIDGRTQTASAKLYFVLKRRMWIAAVSLFLLGWALAAPAVVHAQSPADGFAPNFDNEVRAFALQGDGGLVVGGAFTKVGATLRSRLARLDVSGALDMDFEVSANQTVYALAIQDNGAIVLGGAFTQVNGAGRNRLARVSADGLLDPAFNPNVNGAVRSIALLADGKLLIAGEFTMVAGQSRTYLARLHSDGTLDVSFAPALNGAVYALAVQEDGGVVVGGAFTEVNGQPRAHLARFDAAGALDPGLAPVLNGPVYALTLDFDGSIVVGGDFTSVNSVARGRLARFAPTGALAAAPALTFDGAIHALAIQADGRIIAGGAFLQVNGQSHPRLVRVGLNGALDPTFSPTPNGAVYALLIQPDDKLVAGGAFTLAGAALRNRAARFYEDGSLDADFDPLGDENVNAEVMALALQADGKVLAGGTFPSFDGEERLRLARFWPDGRLDANFAPRFNGDVRAIAVQPDGKIIVAGGFTQVNNQSRPFIARLLADGSPDAGFAPLNDGDLLRALAVALQPDGKIVVAVEFKEQTNRRPRLLRLHPDGAVDASFQPALHEGLISSLAIQQDGRILACGEFTAVLNAEVIAGNLVRLRPTGEFDPTYAPELGRCLALALQPDGRLLVGGIASSLLVRLNADGSLDEGFNASLSNGYVSAILLHSDGRITVANNYEENDQKRGRVLRLTHNGAPDPSFEMHVADNAVLALALQKDGKVLTGGGFTQIGSQAHGAVPRVWLARLSATSTSAQRLAAEPDAGRFVWNPSAAFPAFHRVEFAASIDGGATYTPLARGAWSDNRWQANFAGAPLNQIFWLRARGAFAGGGFNASTGLVEAVTRAFIPGGELEIATLVNPTHLAPSWRVEVAGATPLTAAWAGAGATGVRGVAAGLYTVTLHPGDGVSFNDYDVGYACTVDGQPGLNGSGNSFQITVNPQSRVRCTFTLTRRTGSLEVRHTVEPAAPGGEWELRVTGPTAYTATLPGATVIGPLTVFTGAYTLELTPRSGGEYRTTYQCISGSQSSVSGEGAQATLSVERGERVTCDFRSVRIATSHQLFLPLMMRSR